MLVTLKELLAIAEAENKAIGSFTCPNMEIAMGTIKAAEEMNSPIIIQIAEGRLKHTPLNMIGPLMVQAARDAKVKIAVHLDHGLTAEKAKEALGYGYTSCFTHVPGSFQQHLPYWTEAWQSSFFRRRREPE